MTCSLLRLTLLVVPLTVLVLGPAPARACSPPAVGPPHLLDPAEEEIDDQAPETPEIGAIEVTPYASSDNGCDLGPECGSGGGRWVKIPVTARDDRTPASEMGYLLTRDGGPPGFALSSRYVRAREDGMIWLRISSDSEVPFSFELDIQSVDLGGNISAASSTARVSDPGSAGGCAIGRGAGRPGGLIIAALALAVALSRRRAGRRSTVLVKG
jgi:hypothetical protein